MKQAIRFLGWAARVLWIVVIIFSITALLSGMNLLFSIMPREPTFSLSEGAAVMSIPFVLNNTGYYDITDLNVTTLVTDHHGAQISRATNVVPLIPRGNCTNATLSIVVNLTEIASRDLTYLLLEDGNFTLATSVSLRFAYAIPLRMSLNATMPWGAPLHNFSVGGLSFDLFNLTHLKALIPLGFENHSPFLDINATVRFELYNDTGGIIGSETIDLHRPPNSEFEEDRGEVLLSRLDATPSGKVRVYFETPQFRYELPEFRYELPELPYELPVIPFG